MQAYVDGLSKDIDAKESLPTLRSGHTQGQSADGNIVRYGCSTFDLVYSTDRVGIGEAEGPSTVCMGARSSSCKDDDAGGGNDDDDDDDDDGIAKRVGVLAPTCCSVALS